MRANKRIPVTEEVWEQLSHLKRAGQTYDELLEEMVEEHKKGLLFRELKAIEKRDDFVELE